MGRYRSVLRRRDVRRLFAALLVSATGSWAYNVALLAFVFDRTHSLAWVGAAGIGRFVPQLLVTPYAGVLAERMERIGLMSASDLLCTACQAGLAALAATHGSPAVAIVLAGATSVCNSVYAPATAATIPSLVDEDDLTAANALQSTIDQQLVVMLGPALGALLLVIGPPSLVFAVNAGSFLASALIVRTIRARSLPVDVTEGGQAGPLQQMIVGVRTIVELPAARTLVAYSGLVSFLYGADTVLFVGVSDHRLGTGTAGFGYLMVGLALGGVLLTPAVDRLAGSGRLGPIILAGALGHCLPTALLTVIHTAWLAVLVQIVRGGSTLVVDVLAVTALQRAVDSDRLARVFGAFFAFILGAIALGTVITPAITGAYGLNTGLLAMAIAPALAALAGFPALLAIDRATAPRAAQLAPTVALLEGLGLFEGAGRPILERLAAAATPVEFPPATAIVREGDPADALYVLAAGEVEVTSRGETGDVERRIRTMAAPAQFGEIGVLERIPRTATVTAVTACRCARIEGEALLEALTASPPSSSLMESARSRLAVTHPSRRIEYADSAL